MDCLFEKAAKDGINTEMDIVLYLLACAVALCMYAIVSH